MEYISRSRSSARHMSSSSASLESRYRCRGADFTGEGVSASSEAIENEGDTRSTLRREARKHLRLRTSREPAMLSIASAKLSRVNVVATGHW